MADERNLEVRENDEDLDEAVEELFDAWEQAAAAAQTGWATIALPHGGRVMLAREASGCPPIRAVWK